MKLGKLAAILLLCFTMAGCASSNDNTTMEEIDYRLEDAGYKITQLKDADDKPIGMQIEKLNIVIMLMKEKDKLSSIVYTDKLSNNQYAMDVTNNTAMSVISHDKQTCMYDIEGGKKQKNPSICNKKDEEAGQKLHDDFSAFLKELNIDIKELKQFYNWYMSA